MSQQTTFSIENNVNPETSQPFGTKYGGMFSIRRPSLADKRNIALKDAASMNAYGQISPDQISSGLSLINYIFSFMSVVSTEEPPAWFSMDKIFDDTDESAVLAVWDEVKKYLDSFRRKDGGDGGKPAGDQPSLLVPAQV